MDQVAVKRQTASKSRCAHASHPLSGSASVSVIVPVFNEIRTVGELLARVLDSPFATEVIVIDDGSTDGSSAVVRAALGDRRLRLLSHGENRGKGAAVRTGLNAASGQYVLIQDADLEYDPNDYAAMLQPVLAGVAEVAYGARQNGPTLTCRSSRVLARVAVQVLNSCVHRLYGVRLSDEATCYKLFPAAALRAMNLECEGFEFCAEVTAKACRMGLRIVEVPISYAPRTRREGKKIRWRDGVAAIRTLWKWRHWCCTTPWLSEPVHPNPSTR